MDRKEIRERSRELYGDELQYAIAREDEVNTDSVRERATRRLSREMEGQEIYELCRGLIDGIARSVERGYVVDLDGGQLMFGSAIRTGANTLCPTDRARLRDWVAFDEIREEAFKRHEAKREREREVIAEIIEQLQAHGEDATTYEVCPERFPKREAEAAA